MGITETGGVDVAGSETMGGVVGGVLVPVSAGGIGSTGGAGGGGVGLLITERFKEDAD